jgi:hypothetical protein
MAQASLRAGEASCQSARWERENAVGINIQHCLHLSCDWAALCRPTGRAKKIFAIEPFRAGLLSPAYAVLVVA